MSATDAPLEDLTPEDARRILSTISPLLEKLRAIADTRWRARPPGVADRERFRSGDRRARRAAAVGSLSDASPPPEAGQSSASEPFDLGEFELETARTLAAEEWCRRTGRESGSCGDAVRTSINALLARGMEPGSPVRDDAARSKLRAARRELEGEGGDREMIDRELRALSGALWHVLLTAGIPVERAIAMRDAIDGILLEDVEQGPLLSRPPLETQAGETTVS